MNALDARVLALFSGREALTRSDVMVGLEQEFGFIVGILGVRRSIGRLVREGLLENSKEVGGADTGWAVRDAYRATDAGRYDRHVVSIPLLQRWLQAAMRRNLPLAYRKALRRLR